MLAGTLQACSFQNLPERSTFERGQSAGVVRVTELLISQEYYVYSASQLVPRLAFNLKYKGTERGYHFFRIYQKHTTDERLVYRVALPEAECEVSRPLPLADAPEAYGNKRHAQVQDGRCVVSEP